MDSSATKPKKRGELSWISTGIMASDPYTRLKGVSMVEDRGVVWYAHTILGTSSAHAPLVFSNLRFKPLNKTLFADSTYPFVRGCSTDANTCLIPTFVHSFPNCWLANWVPLSEMRHLGTPKRHTMFFQTKCCTLCAVICATGSASIHLVKYSMATIKYFIYLIASGNEPRISIPQVWKGHGLYMDLSSSGGALCQSACI